MLFHHKLPSSSPASSSAASTTAMLPSAMRPPWAVTTATATRQLDRLARGCFQLLRSSRCRRIIMWIGRCRRQGHVAAIEFGYDPMSYALNFEDDQRRELDKEFPARNFSARLLVSLDRLLPVKLPREVVACS